MDWQAIPEKMRDWSVTHPALAAILAAVVLVSAALLLFRRRNRAEKTTDAIADALAMLAEETRRLSEAQQRLEGGLHHVSELQTQSQARMVEAMERRLEAVQKAVGETLQGTAQRTARSLGELQQRLETIDRAQAKIEKLSGDVLSLQDILSNKQARGAFGEIQLQDIVTKALPPDSYRFQATLSNGRRPDCLVHLPNPPGPIVIDAKFPLEAYEQLRAATSEAEARQAARAFREAVRKHIAKIRDSYIIEGETADGAIMFLPSEAVYAELHANFGDVVREGFEARVWIVSPTTCMATLNTMRAILKDARMREQAHLIRRELGLLNKDVERLGKRVESLDRHFSLAAKDIDDIRISAQKAGKRAHALERFEFEEPPVLEVATPERGGADGPAPEPNANRAPIRGPVPVKGTPSGRFGRPPEDDVAEGA